MRKKEEIPIECLSIQMPFFQLTDTQFCEVNDEYINK